MLKTTQQERRCIYDLLRNISDFVFEVSREGIIRHVLLRDPRLMPNPEQTFVGKSISAFIVPEMVDSCLRLIETALSERETGFIEYTSPLPNGARAKYEIRVLPVFPAPGHCFILVEDVTARTSMEFIEDRWKMALDAAGDGMWDADLIQNTLFFSDKWYQMTGYKPCEIAPYTEAWLDKVHPEDIGPARKRLVEFLKGDISEYAVEVRFLMKTGKYRWLLTRGVVVSRSADGRATRIIGTHADIDARKVAEQQLQTSMDTFASAFRYSANGMAIVGTDGRWLDVNESICQMLEYTKEEMRNLRFQDITHADDLATDLKLVRVLLEKKLDKYDLEKRYITKSGRPVWTLLTVSLVWNPDGSPRFFIAQIVDITVRKEMADELLRKNQELDEARVSLEKQVKQLEELNHIIGHNLRGPAGNLKMLIGALKAKAGIATEDNPAGLHEVLSTEEILDLMEKSSRGQMGTLDTLMQLTQIGLNKNIPYEECDIEKAAQDVMSQLQVVVAQKKARIRFELGLKTLSYPRVYLDSILYNLVSNALKYSCQEGVPEIVISSWREKNSSRISVKDNGLGIDLARHGHNIFKLNKVFHQGYDSKGVGLFITKAQIEALGGSIEVVSQPNVGSEFTVRI